jgi:hypothetical protein
VKVLDDMPSAWPMGTERPLNPPSPYGLRAASVGRRSHHRPVDKEFA